MWFFSLLWVVIWFLRMTAWVAEYLHWLHLSVLLLASVGEQMSIQCSSLTKWLVAMYNYCSFPLCGSWCVLLDEQHDWLNSCIVCTCASSPPSVWSCESWDNKLGWMICGIEHMCNSVFLQGSVYAWNAFLQLNLFWIDEAFLEPCSTSNVFLWFYDTTFKDWFDQQDNERKKIYTK